MPFVSALNMLVPVPIFTVTPSIEPAVIVPISALIADRLPTSILTAVTALATIESEFTASVSISLLVIASSAIFIVSILPSGIVAAGAVVVVALTTLLNADWLPVKSTALTL